MSDWSHGYDVSTEYSYGFYREMAPDWLDLCAWIGGFAPPVRREGSFRYLDLGCGQGFGVCLLAAANPQSEFVGIDFQPEHIAHAQGLAQAAGLSNARFVQADFLDLAADWPSDFGIFDYVVLHGIISWVSPSLRDAVVECLAHAVAPGGLVYVSYNAHPGCLSTIPLQHFALRIKESAGGEGAAPAEQSIALLDGLATANAPVFHALPMLKSRVAALKARDKNYLVHEYLTESWRPFWPSEVGLDLRRAGLDFVGSATLADNLVQEFLQPPLYQAVMAQESPDLRRDVEAFIINQAFRRDIFCRGATPRANSKEKLRVYLAAHLAPSRSLSFETSFGQISWDPSVFAAIVEAVADGPRPLEDLLKLPNPTMWKARHVLLLLLHATVLAPEAIAPGSIEIAQRFNAAIARAASEGGPYRSAAAATIGSGLTVSEVDLLLIDAWLGSSGRADAATLAQGLSERLESLGRAEAAEQLTSYAQKFVDEQLPIYRQLGVLG